ncbi:DUF1800 domain-containing protein [Pleurocapsa sp. PCC 7319]|uniref:DUF1800 domain-containing protein n=1 Tax=Pleurocapsa sp. PCC 7319 TaxID=118161 RepID=UPI0003467460|nr:DUF1800 domain-containing protein [Pleurocapsa sp. PCC 7319]
MRQKLQYGILILICSSILWFGWTQQAEAKSELYQPQIVNILERLSFGTTSEQVHQVATNSIEAYIQSQLNPQQIPESPIVEQFLAELDLKNQDPLKLHKQLVEKRKLRNSSSSVAQKEKVQEQISQLNKKARDQATDARLVRAIYSSRQLQEVMVDFWFNHFNVFAAKKNINFWLSSYENEIRANALGNFRDLLGATARHPAMLLYLDNVLNTAPNSPGAKGQFKGLNENYARELMELHTLGVNGGYTQDDIVTLARIFTGWGVDYQGKRGEQNGFFFDKNRHDRGEKIFLGHKITANGIEEGKQALDILATHPATAGFISYKLAQYFVADQPPSSLVDMLTEKFLDSNGNIKVILDALIHSQEFNNPEYYNQKFKTPYQYLVSLVRTAEIEQPDFKRIRGMLSQLSMPMYMCVPPTGYKNTQEAWLNPQAMLQRIGLAMAIANNALNRDYLIEYKQLEANFGDLSQRTKQVIAQSPPKLRSALILGSPEAMYR